VNSAHDVGGMHGFGPIVREEDEPVFHADWERRVFALSQLVLVQGLVGSLDSFRHAMERMGNASYLSSSYYEHWLAGAQMRLIENGVITEDELRARTEAVRADPARFAMAPAEGPDELSALATGLVESGFPSLREIEPGPKFAAGDDVLTTRRSPTGHTRMPRYARGRRGSIVFHHGAFVFADASADGLGDCPEHLYTVRFDASELWDGSADGRGSVSLDLSESYLAPVGEAK
jgi:nitrile hydratase subunit beta